MTTQEDKPGNSSISTEVEWVSISLGREKRDSDTRRILSSLPLFSNLSIRDWRELMGLFHSRTFLDDEVIFRRDTPGLGMYIVIDGNVSILDSEKGAGVEIARLTSGDFFGEMTLIEEIDRTATAVSVGTTNLIGIFRPQLKDLMHRRPRLGLILMERLARIVVNRLHEANQRLTECREKLKEESKH